MPRKIEAIDITKPEAACPKCGRFCWRHSVSKRTLHDLGFSNNERRVVITYNKYHCAACEKFFSPDMTEFGPRCGRFTHSAIKTATDMIVDDGMTFKAASALMRRKFHLSVPITTLSDWVGVRRSKEQQKKDVG